jgi:dihydrofolate synthase/folylpolyglutamate synthase
VTGSARRVETAASPRATPAERQLAAVLDRLEMWGQRLGLERIRELLERLRAPQLRYPVVLIAGTNGKGSTATFLSAILRSGGARVGLHTSPHLESVEERIRVDGRAIATERLLEALTRVLDAARGMTEPPTYFEAITAAGFVHFAETSVDIGVVEVGLGGRLDATNASEPVLSVITPIGFDHEEHLGSHLAAIAREKAGILRPGRRALGSDASSTEVRAALELAATEVGSELRFVEDEVSFESCVSFGSFGSAGEGPGTGTWRFDFGTPAGRYELVSALRGRHQAVNLALAVRAAERLRAMGLVRLDHRTVAQGVARARWPGRLESVVLPGGGRVLLDGAHNEAGVRALVDYLRSAPEPDGRDLLFASLVGKRAERTLPLLISSFERVTLTEPPSPKALPASSLRVAAPAATVQQSVAEALESALESAGARELVVCGSLYLVGAVRGLLRRRFGTPEAAVDVVTG